MDELPNPMLKMETSNHKMNTCWFVEFSRLKLGGNKKSLYCMTCYCAFIYKRFNPIDMRTCEGNNNMVWINREAEWVNFKKGRDGIVKHGDCGLHKRAEFALAAARQAHVHRVILVERIATEYEQNRIALKAVFEVVRVWLLRGHRDEDNSANFNCLFKLVGKFNTCAPRPILGVLRRSRTIFVYELSKLFFAKFTQFTCYARVGLPQVMSEAGFALWHYLFLLKQTNPMNGKELYDAVKLSALDDLHLDLPILSRVGRAHGARPRAATQVKVTEEEIKEFHTGIYMEVMRVGAKALTDRYSSNDLAIVELLHRSLEDFNLSDSDLPRLVKFYEADVQFEMLRQERHSWFARCAGLGVEPTIKTLRSAFVEETSLKFLLPNLHMLCIIYVCVPVSVCEAERSFSMMRRIHQQNRAAS